MLGGKIYVSTCTKTIREHSHLAQQAEPPREDTQAPTQPPRDTSFGSTNVDDIDIDGEMDRCGQCGTLATTQTLHLCAGCRQRVYCSRSCQLVAWRAGHKKECKLLKADAETRKNFANISAVENEQDVPKENNTDPPDGPSAEPANGPACAEPDPGPGPQGEGTACKMFSNHSWIL